MIDDLIRIEVLRDMHTNTGESLQNLSEQQPVLLVFLRHFGCYFCKEAMEDLAVLRPRLESNGIRLVFVHMSEYDVATKYFEDFKLKGVTNIKDVQQQYYRAFGLTKGSFTQLFGLRTWMRGFSIKKEKGYSVEMSKSLGDSTQMPGIFLLHKGEVKEKYVHRSASDRPDYEKIISCTFD